MFKNLKVMEEQEATYRLTLTENPFHGMLNKPLGLVEIRFLQSSQGKMTMFSSLTGRISFLFLFFRGLFLSSSLLEQSPSWRTLSPHSYVFFAYFKKLIHQVPPAADPPGPSQSTYLIQAKSLSGCSSILLYSEVFTEFGLPFPNCSKLTAPCKKKPQLKSNCLIIKLAET